MRKEKKYRKKKKLGSYPIVSVVFSITLALFVIGLFGLLFMITQNLTTIIQENVEMQIFLNNNLSETEKVKITKILSSKDYVAKRDDLVQLHLIPKEDAAKDFYEGTGEDFVAFLGDNPLKDVIVIKVHPAFHNALNLKEIKKEISFIRGVYEVTYVESLTNSIHENVKKVSFVLIGISCILFLVVVILINNTIKLALFSQRFLIRSMQLVGATAGFIRRPFLLRASLFGILSAVFSCALLYTMLHFLDQKVDGLLALMQVKQMIVLAIGIALMGIFVGFISTFVAIRKYMKMSLDELY